METNAPDPNEYALLERIRQRPETLGGKPVVRRTRIAVKVVMDELARGMSEQEILREYPRLEPEDLKACRLFVARGGDVLDHAQAEHTAAHLATR